MSEFLAMGGYASYIWPAYGISAVVLVALVVQSLAAYRRAIRDVKALEAGVPVYDKSPASKSASKPASTDAGSAQEAPR